jgi:DNA-binding Lrp family transcriptional regulator
MWTSVRLAGPSPKGAVVITAIVQVYTAADRIPETAQAIADLDGVSEVYSCAGDVDLIAVVKVAEHEQLADVIAGRLSKIEGVQRTDTHIAFRSYSRADTEATFSVGLD